MPLNEEKLKEVLRDFKARIEALEKTLTTPEDDNNYEDEERKKANPRGYFGEPD